MRIVTGTLITAMAVLSMSSALAQTADEIMKTSGVKGGVVVHLGCGDGKLTATLRVNEGYLVHGLDTDPAKIATARQHVLSAGQYGPISFDTFDGKSLPYADNTVNLLVTPEKPGVGDEELLRVLTPRGVALVGERKLTKPVPAEIDEWSHFQHGPGNNPVARDTLVAPPRRMQWVAGPCFLRSHEVPSGVTSMITAGGRLFYTLDEGPIGIVDGRFPERWSLIARDAFNGVLLWKIPLPQWGWQTWKTSLKKADMTATRGLRLANPRDYRYRLVADAKRVYFTLGNKAPVSIIDAASGKVLTTCSGTEGCRKLLVSGGALLVELGSNLLVFDSVTGKELWKQQKVSAVAANGSRVVYRLGSEIHCVEAKTGTSQWKAKLDVPGNLIISDDVILALAGSRMQTLSLKDGKSIWSTGKGAGGSKKKRGKSPGIYVIGDTIWLGYRGQRLSLKTGKKLPDLGVKNLWSPQHHHRCYTNKASSRFIIGAMEGMEYLAVDGSDDHSRNNWVRGACSAGIMPANGMTYAPPDQCFCSAGVKLLGFSALLGAAKMLPIDPPEKRLLKGPAYSEAKGTTDAADWPAYRHDALRSGSSAAQVPAELKKGWQLELGGILTQPVVAGDLVYIASRDTHTLHAIDANTGKKQWSFTAGGRIDSPPTIHKGLALFGSTDGHVYCLRSTDGQLAWRFRAAPHQRLIGSFSQLESAWPVHGSVLVLDDVAYVSAGRSTYLDGGIFLYAMDPATGKVLHQHQELGPYEDHKKDFGHSYWSEGARNDVLVSDGEHIYIMQLRFNRKLEPVPAKTESLLGDRKLGRRVFSTAGFLNDEWYNRTFWMHSNLWPGYYLANQASKSGQLLVFDKQTTYGIKVFWTRNRHSPMFFPDKHGYLLFADANDNEPILVGRDKGSALTWLPKFNLTRGGNDKGKKFGPNLGPAPQVSDVNAFTFNKDKGVGFTRAKEPIWAEWIPIRVKGMVVAGDKLFVAGAPDVFDEKDPFGGLEGRKGAVLRAVSTANGKKLSEYTLESPPVFDGLIAAQGKLFIASRDGKLTCWGE